MIASSLGMTSHDSQDDYPCPSQDFSHSEASENTSLSPLENTRAESVTK